MENKSRGIITAKGEQSFKSLPGRWRGGGGSERNITNTVKCRRLLKNKFSPKFWEIKVSFIAQNKVGFHSEFQRRRRRRRRQRLLFFLNFFIWNRANLSYGFIYTTRCKSWPGPRVAFLSLFVCHLSWNIGCYIYIF